MQRAAAEVQAPSPHRVIWVLNAACPSRCTYCDIESQRATTTLDAAGVERVCHEVLAAGFSEVVFVGGEPLLADELPVALGVLAGKCSVAVFTGGLPGPHDRYLEALALGVDRLVLSIDSGRDRANDLVRGRRGITNDLIRLTEAVRARLPRVRLSVNTVVSRHNADTVADVWDRMAPFGLDSWSLTLAGDNFQGSPSASLLSREQLERLYLRTIPDLARTLAAARVELVVLPIPLPLLTAGIHPGAWGTHSARLRDEIAAELDRYAAGDFNRSFVTRFGCPLVGVDVSIGVGGEVYPCSQAPAIQPAYVVGDLRRESLADVLGGAALRAFAAAVPHAPCSRCWAPSNVERARLAQLVGGKTRRAAS